MTNYYKKVYILENLGCAHCASKMEALINDLPEVQEATITYATKQLRVTAPDPDRLLPEFQREALVLHYYYGCKYREIGKMTGVPAATVKSRVRQGCRKLRELLGEDVL